MINTLTLNPAIDHIFYMDRFRRNVTNRPHHTAVSIGGKGTHVSVNLALMGTPSRAFGFSFGRTGERILDMLREDGITTHFIHGEQQESRDNYLLVEEETRDCTLIAQKGPQPDENQLAAFYALLLREVMVGDDLLLSGDVSNFSGQDIYGHVQEVLADKNLRVFLDTSGPSLRECVKRKPYLIKPNLHELGNLVGRTLASQEEIVQAILSLESLDIHIIAVSLGGAGAIVRADDRLYRAKPPEVKVYNTVGCGDCFIAGLMHVLAGSRDIKQALRYATAVSAAKAESPLSVGFDIKRASELLDQVEIHTI